MDDDDVVEDADGWLLWDNYNDGGIASPDATTTVYGVGGSYCYVDGDDHSDNDNFGSDGDGCGGSDADDGVDKDNTGKLNWKTFCFCVSVTLSK